MIMVNVLEDTGWCVKAPEDGREYVKFIETVVTFLKSRSRTPYCTHIISAGEHHGIDTHGDPNWSYDVSLLDVEEGDEGNICILTVDEFIFSMNHFSKKEKPGFKEFIQKIEDPQQRLFF